MSDTLKPEERLQQAISRGDVLEPSNARSSYQCQICECDLSNKNTIKNHLVTQKHKENEKARRKTPAVRAKNADAVTEKTPKPAGRRQEVVKETPKTLEQRLQLAIQDGHVAPPGRYNEPYHCRICDRDLKTRDTMKKHIDTATHKKNEAQLRAKSTGAHYVDSLSSKSEGNGIAESDLKHQPTRIKLNPPGRFGQRKKNHADLTPYPVNSKPRGRVYVFNYLFTGRKSDPTERRGAERDSPKLRHTFRKMGYHVSVHEELNATETNSKIEEIRCDKELCKIDALIIFFLSHGKRSHLFYTCDKQKLDFRHILNQFTDTKCPAMKRKPKIFFTNFCRGKSFELPERDGKVKEVMDIPRDTVTIYAASEGISALRDPNLGTYFVQALCEVLREEENKRLDLRQIYHKLDAAVKNLGGTQPKWEDFRFRPFYF